MQAVLADIESQQITIIFCLGDSVGYGFYLEEVIYLLKKHNVQSVMGKHDEAIINENAASDFSDRAREAIEVNKQMLGLGLLMYLSDLPKYISFKNIRFVHGLPPHSNNIYVNYAEAIALHMCTVEKIRYYKVDNDV